MILNGFLGARYVGDLGIEAESKQGTRHVPLALGGLQPTEWAAKAGRLGLTSNHDQVVKGDDMHMNLEPHGMRVA